MSHQRRLFYRLLTGGAPLSLAALLLFSTASAQPRTPSQQPPREVPEAEQPGTPDEARWWQEVRAAAAEAVAAAESKGQALAEASRHPHSSGEEADLIPPQRLRQLDEEIQTTKEKFLGLLRQGREKSYRVPLASRPPMILHKVRATYTDEARRQKVEGVIAAAVRFQADGTLGEVSIIRGLGSGLDEKAIRAARQVIFLPAVRNGAFVTVRGRMEFTFKIY